VLVGIDEFIQLASNSNTDVLNYEKFYAAAYMALAENEMKTINKNYNINGEVAAFEWEECKHN